MKRITPALVLILLSMPAVSLAAQTRSETEFKPTARSLRLAGTYQELAQAPFESTSRSAAGIAGVYEFQLSTNFSLGISLAYRHYAGQRALNQLGYGLLMRHSLPFVNAESLRPYLAYGLLAQTSSLEGSRGSGTSHDTRLTAGADFEASRIPLFFEVSYHLSRLKFLNVDSLNLDYWETTLGWRASI